MPDELIETIDQADTGKAPSPFGKLAVVIPGAPVSVQSTKTVRDAYIARIKSELARFSFVLTGQLMLDITWLVPAKSRYETDAKADIDNCIKPIIDAFTGPDGVFINDCQLKGLFICWRHIESGEEQLIFEITFDPDQWCDKTRLVFIRLERGLCCPVNTMWPKHLREGWVQAMRTGENFKAELELLGTPYLALAGMTGGNQPFHITRTAGFAVLSGEAFASGTDEESE